MPQICGAVDAHCGQDRTLHRKCREDEPHIPPDRCGRQGAVAYDLEPKRRCPPGAHGMVFVGITRAVGILPAEHVFLIDIHSCRVLSFCMQQRDCSSIVRGSHEKGTGPTLIWSRTKV